MDITTLPKDDQEIYLKALDCISKNVDKSYKELKPLIDKECNYFVKQNGSHVLVSHLVEFGYVARVTEHTSEKVYENSEFTYRRIK
jgi:hypothetical protein